MALQIWVAERPLPSSVVAPSPVPTIERETAAVPPWQSDWSVFLLYLSSVFTELSNGARCWVYESCLGNKILGWHEMDSQCFDLFEWCSIKTQISQCLKMSPVNSGQLLYLFCFVSTDIDPNTGSLTQPTVVAPKNASYC